MAPRVGAKQSAAAKNRTDPPAISPFVPAEHSQCKKEWKNGVVRRGGRRRKRTHTYSAIEGKKDTY